MATNPVVVDHVEAGLGKIREMFDKAVARIEEIKPGEKIPATKLAQDIAAEYNMTGPELYPTLLHLFRGYPGVEIRRGAHGGIYRPDPTKKDAKKSKDDSASVESASVEPDQK